MIFRVINYCRMKDVFKRSGQSFNFSLNEPLIVLNNFAENNQVRQWAQHSGNVPQHQPRENKPQNS